MNYDEHLTFTINQVAEILGVVPATVRNWEKNGLFTAKRSSNNYRFFTPGDLDFLSKIKEYSVDRHLSIDAIKKLLGADSKDIAPLEDYIEKQKEKEGMLSKKFLSEKWRESRKQHGYTLEELSSATGISVAHLSTLENGGNVSLDMMNKLAIFYGESPLMFMEPPQKDKRLIKKGDGEKFQLKDDSGISMVSLVSMKNHVMYPVMCTVQPGCGNMEPHRHNGEEFIYVFSGVIEYKVGDEPPYIIHADDSFYYKGEELHSWKNISNKPATLLWVHSALSK